MDAAGIPPADMPVSALRGVADEIAVGGIPLALPRSVTALEVA